MLDADMGERTSLWMLDRGFEKGVAASGRDAVMR
jgi:hypothetical protein